MAGNRTKYPPEFREEICGLIIESKRSATSMAEEHGIDKNTVCNWMRNYTREHSLPSYAEERGIAKSARAEESEARRKDKETELEIWRLRKENKQLKEEEKI